jgi:hypothetical protein
MRCVFVGATGAIARRAAHQLLPNAANNDQAGAAFALRADQRRDVIEQSNVHLWLHTPEHTRKVMSGK